MSARELVVLISICMVWGFHFVVVKLGVAQIPPIFYAAIRMSLVAILMAPFLRIRHGMGRLFAGGLCLGFLNYAFLFAGVSLGTASAAAIAVELNVPFATILSVVVLKEKVGVPRILGIALAFVGVAVIAFGDGPGEARLGGGVGLVALGAVCEATGAILVKTLEEFRPPELLAWFAVIGAVCLWCLTGLVEEGQRAAFAASDKALIGGAILYSALMASIFAHTAYYWLLKRLPVSVVAPSALLTTFLAVAFSSLFLKEPVGWRIVLGGALTLFGVGIVLLRSARKADATPAVAGGAAPPGPALPLGETESGDRKT